MSRFSQILLVTSLVVVGGLAAARLVVGARPAPPPNILHVAHLRFVELPTPARGATARLPAMHGMPVPTPMGQALAQATATADVPSR